MKRLIVLLTLLYPVLSAAQIMDFEFDRNKITVSNTTGQITYTFIDSVPGASKDILYSKALEWVALNFNDANNVIKLKDREGGKIVVKGMSPLIYYERWFKNDVPNKYDQYYTIDFTFKDNKYRIILTDFILKTVPVIYSEASEKVFLEKCLNGIPSNYSFANMKRSDQQRLVKYKQVVMNTYNLSNGTFQSIKAALIKSDW